uniref:CCHC-type domain-containing protein n=1 Tax=Scophthalmus maximus TaxID=52904 RepID=A0A8D3D3U4_SCOMX
MVGFHGLFFSAVSLVTECSSGTRLLSLLLVGVKALMRRSVDEAAEVRPTVDDGPLTEQQLGLRQAEDRLCRDYIHRLLKQSPEYPNYQYLCKLCSVHIENIQGAHKHIKEKRHKKNIMEKQEENELRALPPPAAAQLQAVDECVVETARLHGISDEDFEIRKAVVVRMEEIIKRHLSAEFSEVESDFHAKVPAIFCRDVCSGLICKVSAGNDVACLTTNHLAALSKLEPRLIPLVLAFRYWARTRLTLDLGKGVTLGQLWLELLRFYTLEFALEKHIISIRLKALLSRDLKNWPRRRLAIEDPFALKRNVARSLNSQMVFEYIQERFRTAYKYFACPQRRGHGGCQRSRRASKRCAQLEGGEKEEKEEDEWIGGKKGGQLEEDEEEPDSDDDEDCSDLSRKKDERTLEASLMDLVLSEEGKEASFSANGLLDSDEDEDEEENGVSEKDGIVASDDLHYVFDKMIFTGGKPPTVVCSICKRDGHLKDECPEDFKKIELKPLPPMNERFREILDGLCRQCYYELSPTPVEQQKREQILLGLERFIRKEYNDKAQLCLFGSSKNGFGFCDSDLDICMTLKGHETAEKLNCKEIIEGLAKVLKKHTGLRNILPITTAKVPIVKFEHRQSGLEGDISLYNTLRCDIGDASRGSLSSYAYILMVLYFLQQRQPAVIPVLQEIFDGKTVPERMVDGWNAFFFDNLEDLRRRLSELQPNTESVGELWLGLLRFYTEEFDFKEHVISIRQRKRLTTFEKQWTSKCIAIEDPFDLNHNLGAGVSRKMTNFIMKAFINGRKLFGTPFYPIPSTEVSYFFNSTVLTDGELAPNDRCCRICGKIGHYMKDCPKRRRFENDKDEDAKEEEREPKDRRCFQCGDMGHVRRDCPEYRHLKQRVAGAPAPHMVRTMVSSQSIPIPQAAADYPGRTRQSSECSDSRQTPPYSPQPTAGPLSSSQSSSSPQPSHSKTGSAGPPKPPAHPQVPLSLFSFPTSLPGQYHPGTLTALGLLPSHQSQGQPHHPVHIPSTSWPIHGPVLTAPTGSGVSPNPMNLNDPSIIFAQPAGRQLGLSGPGRDGHWHNHMAPPGSLMGNGTVVKSGIHRGNFWWHHLFPGILSVGYIFKEKLKHLFQVSKVFIQRTNDSDQFLFHH